jgi:hypothetical protein
MVSRKRSDVVKIVNMMFHPLTIVELPSKEIKIQVPPSGLTARVDLSSTPDRSLHVEGRDGVVELPVVNIRPANIKVIDGQGNKFPFPEPAEGTVFIVSTLVAGILRRDDVLSPDTTKTGAIRDGDGELFAVTALQIFK